MGILNRMFSSDPQRNLDRAREELDKGAVEKALMLTQRVLKKEPESTQARDLLGRIHEARVRDFVHAADRCEAAGYPEDAIGWLQQAVEIVQDAAQQDALEERIAALGPQPDEGPQVPKRAEQAPPIETPPADPDSAEEAEYQALVGMLTEDHAQRFDDRSDAFRKAYLDFNEGRIDDALNGYEQLLEAEGDDPVVTFEYARCLMIKARFEEAASYFEKVWDEFGEDDLDEAGSLSVPVLWGEVNLLLGREAQVVERLHHLADPDQGRQSICLLVAHALERLKRLEEAAELLIRANRKFGHQPLIPMLLARVLDELDEGADAIAVLEHAVAPACASGTCGAPPLHLDSLRLLIALCLKHGAKEHHVEELFRHLGRAQSGNLKSEDFRLLSEFHRAKGDEESARLAEEKADQLDQAPRSEEPSAPVDAIKTGDKAIM